MDPALTGPIELNSSYVGGGDFWSGACWLDVLNVGWLRLFPHHQAKRPHAEAGGGVSNSHLLYVWARVNSIIISEAAIMRASVGPTLLQAAGAAHHLTADSSAEGVTPTS